RGSTRRRTARPRRPSRRAGRRRWRRCRCARTSHTAQPRRPARPCRAWHDGGMERLAGAARDRVRAASLWLVVAVVLVFVAWGLWAVYAGSAEVTTVPSEVVAVSDDGRVVTVELVHGACPDPLGLAVDEGRGEIGRASCRERVSLAGGAG